LSKSYALRIVGVEAFDRRASTSQEPIAYRRFCADFEKRLLIVVTAEMDASVEAVSL